jgi:hypothetical protein
VGRHCAYVGGSPEWPASKLAIATKRQEEARRKRGNLRAA